MIEHLQAEPLSDLVIAQLAEEDKHEIIRTAIAEGLTGIELHASLVVSGVALGIDKIQNHVMSKLGDQMGILRKTLVAIDDRMHDAQGDDELSAMLQRLRTPIVEAIREHLSHVEAAFAHQQEHMLGIDRNIFTSRVPLDDIAPEDLQAAGAAATMSAPDSFYGFVQTEAKIECPCPYHLHEHYIHHHEPVETVMRKAIVKYGSVGAAMTAFARHLITQIRKRIDDFEATYGNLDIAQEEGAALATNQLLSQYLSSPGAGSHGPADH